MVPVPSVHVGHSSVEFLVNGQPFRTWVGNIEELKLDHATKLTVLIRDHIAFKTRGPDFDAMAKQMGFPLR